MLLQDQLKEKVKLEVALSSTDDAQDPEGPSSEMTLEMSKKPSYMSEARFNGEVTTPSKMEEKE